MKLYNDYMENISADENLHNKIMEQLETAGQTRQRFRLNPMYALAATLCLIIGLSSVVFLWGADDGFTPGMGSGAEIGEESRLVYTYGDGDEWDNFDPGEESRFAELLALLSASGFDYNVITAEEIADNEGLSMDEIFSVHAHSIEFEHYYDTFEAVDYPLFELYVYEFESAEEALLNASYIGPGGSSFSSPGAGMEVSWVGYPHWFIQDNIIVFYVEMSYLINMDESLENRKDEKQQEMNMSILSFLRNHLGRTFAGCGIGSSCDPCKELNNRSADVSLEGVVSATTQPANTVLPPPSDDNPPHDDAVIEPPHDDINGDEGFDLPGVYDDLLELGNPYLIAIVKEIQGNSVLVETIDTSALNQDILISIPALPFMNSDDVYEVGDIIGVSFCGLILETYPSQLAEIYAILLIRKA